MRVIVLPDQEAFIVDVIAWMIIHLSIGFWSSRIPIAWFNPQNILYRTYRWEKGGKIYQSILHVRSWKCYAPDGGSLYPDTFSMRRLPNYDVEYLERWLKESCRSELCHWLMILPGFLFFFWNSVFLGWFMVFYAVVNNIFPIVIQRFNRPRMQRVLNLLKHRPNAAQLLFNHHRETEKTYINLNC